MAPIGPQSVFDRRKFVGINQETVTDTSSTDYPGHFSGEDNSWNKEIFEQNFTVRQIFDGNFFHTTSRATLTFAFLRFNSIIMSPQKLHSLSLESMRPLLTHFVVL